MMRARQQEIQKGNDAVAKSINYFHHNSAFHAVMKVHFRQEPKKVEYIFPWLDPLTESNKLIEVASFKGVFAKRHCF